ncbi:AAA family ATPase [Halogeometricum sp. S1BR25-6]|uniref:AAA family ATPase n=1 Tax=Halogeometricum salsisoli TaxID=2950536 RepID=A0ABU2GJI1_9EURY|nr:AAA family ATPase [Halogeometricum sp. S1BR25-6]MDS0300945.1 AAA family ATPase [Halogeometricum sp. S1BR25-6]
MSSGDYSFRSLKEQLGTLRRDPETTAEWVKNAATNEEVLDEILIKEQLDVKHESTRQLGEVRRAVLGNLEIPDRYKQLVTDRQELAKIRVPDRVERNARAALEMGKPLVLYGPTGTGKTYFARQLADDLYDWDEVHTATPSWTPSDIIGGIQPAEEENGFAYRKQPGIVSKAVIDAREFGIEWGLILDEITRADISQVFGPLYTAIENSEQTIYQDDKHNVQLDSNVHIICTMNMSDRTVNELDDAITRRFAMVGLDEYDRAARDDLFSEWVDEHVPAIVPYDHETLVSLFHADYDGLNEGTTIDDDEPISRFGPMHYKDIAEFLGSACGSGGQYEDEELMDEAVGQAFATYTLPRLLNTATLPQMRQLETHYEVLSNDEEFIRFDLTPAIELVKREITAEGRQMNRTVFE